VNYNNKFESGFNDRSLYNNVGTASSSQFNLGVVNEKELNKDVEGNRNINMNELAELLEY